MLTKAGAVPPGANGRPAAEAAPAARRGTHPADPYDLIGVGFGPSNLALAIAAEELDPGRSCLFLERNPGVRWHPGMLLEGARMQISYLKDLVSLRNLASPYTFLSYLKAKGRLEKFINIGVNRPTRLEYQDYLSWVADHFGHVVRYESEVVAVAPVAGPGSETLDLLHVRMRDARSGELHDLYARNVVHAGGGTPRRGAPGRICDVSSVIHSGGFLPAFPERFPDHDAVLDLGVVGDGQSAAEITAHILNHYPNARVHLFVPGYALRATDNNPFVNEQFYQHNAGEFYAGEARRRAMLRTELRNTNYGAVEVSCLGELYDITYADEIRGAPRLVVHRASDVARVVEDGGQLSVEVRDRTGGPDRTMACDGLVLATGYTRELNPAVFGELSPLLRRDDSGELLVSADCRVRTDERFTAGFYVQGYAEPAFGIGDTLLSLLPFRSQQIFDDIRGRLPAGRPAALAEPGLYPPGHYVEKDLDRIRSVMERFNFATVISADRDARVLVTHVPLVVERDRGGEHGMLIGHLDRSNPQVELLRDRPVTIVFHGPNSYLSPEVLKADKLPTWNSMSVHVRGHARLFSGRDELMRVFNGLCEQAEPEPGSYRLRPDDERIDQLIGHVVGFEVDIHELTGRFKLSQELDETDRELAAADMARDTSAERQTFIARAFNLTPRSDVRDPLGGPDAGGCPVGGARAGGRAVVAEGERETVR
ncbi:SidA/IucD/PvdA family monooxygenase [Streptomyces olivaceus]|uniref:L-lysine N6-monooxygenase MbtG n=1 Tax=Streptomyces olivaceus TaxID=47716 RepID=A0ABS7WFP8_STROV|nr:SidA/IucD/PvdA family monooxygenase [Streptomyces olivaceus]MBZ6093494.1 SidA/IucD/PvdA family monooxygenase [Streptomyces olivaceus]MBZ6100427.1 SidA/IucD/PvdA family monooxygenase [Streptomyces olivaceus]MBZ6121591.1 SidA/IucD/PvdA family monooxygenase [Streptomyces olivaceus]MBZ6156327.1 SidA/IucD/PvdA family monooxygenase [Streptomyces olivaceus]MBZ6302853.1 SidA/IucD/PvdA family monooxygenase [Streptomyces olivaceus]